MASFKDGAGREWTLRRITVGGLDGLKAAGLDVEYVSEDVNRLGELVTKPRAFAGVLWWFVGDAVTAAGVTPEDFRDALDGDAMAAAATAVGAALVLFFPIPPGAKKRLLARLAADPDGSGDGPSSSPGSPPSTPTG